MEIMIVLIALLVFKSLLTKYLNILLSSIVDDEDIERATSIDSYINTKQKKKESE